jgi:hypothetical protein
MHVGSSAAELAEQTDREVLSQFLGPQNRSTSHIDSLGNA